MMKVFTLSITFLIVMGLGFPPVVAQRVSSYYELVELSYTINVDRTIYAEFKFTIVNTSAAHVITGASWVVPSAHVVNVNAWDSIGPLTHDKTESGDQTTINVTFRTHVRKNEKATYFISFSAGGLVKGAGGEYKARFGGIRTDKLFENYVVRVTGPSGSSLFLTEPIAETLSNQPPTVQYRTRLNAGESFDGLLTTFYFTPAYYKLTLTERISNLSQNASEVMLDLILFNNSQSRFAALANSSQPLAAMYVDNENNWHGNIRLKLDPGEVRDVQLELVLICEIHSPEINETNSGTLDELHNQLFPYLKEDNWWEVNNPSIKQKAREIVGGERNVYLVAKQIVEFVSDFVEYRITEHRQGALKTLMSGYGDCDGYSDLTIALARAVGLPARFCLGWGYQNENFVGHAWAEFYSPRMGWHPVDPTWAKTSGNYLFKLDPVHILRGIYGLTSSESHISYSYHGGATTLSEYSTLLTLTTSEAAQMLIQAGEKTLDLANKLVEQSGGSLNQNLEFARQKLERARLASNEEAIQLAQQSLQYSNEIIQTLGKRLELVAEKPLWFTAILVGVILGAIAMLIISVVHWKKSRR